MLLLQAAIKFEMDDLMNARAFIEQCPPDEADTVVNHACVMFKEAKQPGADPALFEQARLKFVEALNASGFKVRIGTRLGRRGQLHTRPPPPRFSPPRFSPPPRSLRLQG